MAELSLKCNKNLADFISEVKMKTKVFTLKICA